MLLVMLLLLMLLLLSLLLLLLLLLLPGCQAADAGGEGREFSSGELRQCGVK